MSEEWWANDPVAAGAEEQWWANDPPAEKARPAPAPAKPVTVTTPSRAPLPPGNAPKPAPVAPKNADANDQRPPPAEKVDPFKDESLTDLAKRRGQEVAGAFGEGRARTLEGLGIRAQEALKTEGSQEAAGEMLDWRGPMLQEMRDKLAEPGLNDATRKVLEQNIADIEAGNRKLLQVESDTLGAAQNNEWFQNADKYRDWYTQTFGEAPPDDSIYSTLAQGLGSAGQFIVDSMAASAVGGPIAATIVGAGQGSAQNATSIYEEAKAAGQTEEEAVRAAGYGALVGLTEIVPVGRAFGWMPQSLRPKLDNPLMQKIGEIALNAGEEAAQEAFVQISNNAIAIGEAYDEDRSLFDGVGEAALVGAVLGGGLTTAAVAATGKDGQPAPVKAPPPSAGGDTPPDQQEALSNTTNSPAPTRATNADQNVAPDQQLALESAKPTTVLTAEDTIRSIMASRRAAPQPGAAPAQPTTPAPEAAPNAPAATAAPAVAPTPTAPVAQPAAEAAPAVQDAPVAPVTAEGNPAVQPAVEQAPVSQTPQQEPTPVPEAPATIEAQLAGLKAGKKMAVLHPFGANIPAEVEGARFKRVMVPRVGVIDYNAKKITAKEILTLAKFNKLNEVLELGPTNKQEMAQSVAAGNPAVGVVERTPEGTEVKAAAGTTETAPAQQAALEETKLAPENVVQVEDPRQVIADRVAAADDATTEARAGDVNSDIRAGVANSPAEVANQDLGSLMQFQGETGQSVPAPKAPTVEVRRPRAPKAQRALDAGKAREAAQTLARSKGGPQPEPKAEPKPETKSEPAREKRQIVLPTDGRTQSKADEFNAKVSERAKEAVKAESRKAAAEDRETAKEAVRTEMGDKKFASAADEARFRATKVAANKKGKKAVEKKVQDAEKADAIMKEFVPETFPSVRTPEVKRALRDSLQAALATADRQGISIPQRATRETTADSVLWLADARMVARKLATDSLSYSEIDQILADWVSTRKGDSRNLRDRRLQVGEERSKPTGSGDGSNVAAAPTPTAETAEVSLDEALQADTGGESDALPTRADDSDDVGAKVTASRKSAMVDDGTEVTAEGKIRQRGGEVRIVETTGLTDEEKARLLSLLGAAKSRSNPIRSLRDTLFGRARAAERTVDGSERQHAVEVFTLADARERLTSEAAMSELLGFRKLLTGKQRDLQRGLADSLYQTLERLVGNTKIYVLPDNIAEMYLPGADGYYWAPGDYIAIKQSVMEDDSGALHTVLHEASHAAFLHVLAQSEKLTSQLTALRQYAEKYAAYVGEGQGFYGFTDNDEFVAEVWSNPEFQQFLSYVPIMPDDYKMLGIQKTSKPRIRSVLDWIKDKVSDVLGLREAYANLGYDTGSRSVFDAVMDISGTLVDLSLEGRKRYYQKFPLGEGVVGGVKAKRGEAAKKSVADQMRDRGASEYHANLAEKIIMDEFGGTATAEELDGLAAALGYQQALPPAARGELPPKVTRTIAKAEDQASFSRASGMRAGLLHVQTLDYITRRYRGLFKDDKGNALDDYEKATFEFDPIRREVEDLHNEDAAAFHNLRSRDPEEAKKMSQLVVDMAPYDVNLGPGANNDHLGKEAKRGMQAKYHLPDLNAQYAALKPETRALFDKMTANFRETHNNSVRAMTYNILAMLPQRLSNSDTMRLMEATVEGNLTDEDKALINDDTIWKALSNSTAMRVRKGVYFPSERFGDFVVTTRQKIENPNIKSITVVGNVDVPITTEIVDNRVRFTADHGIRGVKAELDRVATKYMEEHELPMLSYQVRYKDKKTGEIVGRTGQAADADYDLVIDVVLQDKGVHFFESRKEAAAFYDQAEKDKASGSLAAAKGPMDRHDVNAYGDPMDHAGMNALIKRITARDDISETSKTQMLTMVRDLVRQQLPGNRYEKKLMARKNVKGASSEVDRAAAHYGRGAANYYGMILTGPKRREALERMRKIESLEENPNAGAVSQVMNELRKREELVGGPQRSNQFIDDMITINTIDKLASPANWVLNLTQVATATMPLLGGRFGNARASAALLSAYGRMGAGKTAGQGLRNSYKGVTQWGNAAVDTSRFVDSIRKNLGLKYTDLIDELVRYGDISDDVGVENAAALLSGRGRWGTSLAKVDRIARQMPNAVEAINRTASAVAAYDLALKGGYGKQDAIKFAVEVVRQSQGRYDSANAPVWMRNNGLLRFFLVFKKYAQLQYQLLGDMTYRTFKGSTPAEKKVAFKQLVNLIAVNAVTTGALGLPGMEAVKAVVLIASALGLSEGVEDEEERIRDLLRESVGKDWEELITRGALSKATGVDFSSRMSWQDMITGFAPGGGSRADMMEYVGTTILGAPGAMPFDWLDGINKLHEGDIAGFLTRTVPIKLFSDTVKAMDGAEAGKLTKGEALLQATGFRSLRQAVISDEIGARIREQTKGSPNRKLYADYYGAITKEQIAEATRAIQEHNRKLPKGERPINISSLEKRRKENASLYELE